MHCNLKPPVPTVIMGFNHEAGFADPYCNIAPNFSAIAQSATELQRFNHLKFGRRSPSWIWPEVDYGSSVAFENP